MAKPNKRQREVAQMTTILDQWERGRHSAPAERMAKMLRRGNDVLPVAVFSARPPL